jgi:hypothetical protein
MTAALAALTKGLRPTKIQDHSTCVAPCATHFVPFFSSLISMTEPVSTHGSDPEASQVTNLSQARAESVQAELVRMHQSAAQTVSAGEVELQISAVAEVKADRVDARQSALALVSSGEVTLTNSAAVAVRAERVGVNGAAGAVVANTVNLGNAYAGLVAGREVRGERIESVVLLGNRVEGEVHTVVDTRGALLAGLVGGLFGGLILLLGRMLFRRD